MADAKKVVVQLPGKDKSPSIAVRYELELEALEPIGVELIESGTTDEDEFIELAKDCDGILTSWGVRMTAKIIKSLNKCCIIGVGSIGVDMVDVDAATEAGIVVTNTPDIFIEEVADHAMMLLLAQNKLLKELMRYTKEGAWFEKRPVPSEIPRLWGETLGLLGFGNVGVAVARRALPFGMRVIAYDPYVSELKMTAEGVEPVSFKELLERSDYLSIHAPHNSSTTHLLGEAEFKAMKKTARIVNTARGPLMDEKALIKALQDGEIAGAGLDVTEQEPPEKDNPLRDMENVLLTPHTASASTRMRIATRRRAACEVALALSGRWPQSAVNPDVLPRTNLERWQPISMHSGPNR
jgi:D-3-phosphoglycerate dehydrogenase